jgi:hypothetical protein
MFLSPSPDHAMKHMAREPGACLKKIHGSHSVCPFTSLLSRSLSFCSKGTIATVGAFTMATRRMRSGDSKSMNRWLRARVALQGVTVLALLYGYYTMGHGDPTGELRTKKEQDLLEEYAAAEKETFMQRLKKAEDAYRQEIELAVDTKKTSTTEAPSSWSSWWNISSWTRSNPPPPPSPPFPPADSRSSDKSA